MPLPPPLTGDVLVVSPHLDDAVLSCETLIGRAGPLDVLTVSTARPTTVMVTEWDTLSGFRDSDEAMEVRLLEDEAALAGTPHRRQHLGLLDQQYLPRGERPPEDAATLTAWVDAWLTEHEGGLVLLPTATGLLPDPPPPRRPLVVRAARRLARAGLEAGLEAGHGGIRLVRAALSRGEARRTAEPSTIEPPAIGGAGVNPDHRWVRDTLTEHLAGRLNGRLAGLGRGGSARFGYYEDVPYGSARPGQDEIDGLVERHGFAVQRLEVPVDRVAKARRIACYATQIAPLRFGPHGLDEPEGLPELERYWLT
ncbi:hypothetical protein [Arsenicicoccus bolidensis]|uniref:hypothetical protein n=1 Tax=Arsenicicoccus bolidensis TaxID=229480 RepID=UPI000427157C|nr:hypothetical protein [Arsenicicoccus bolidensis]